MTSTSRPCEFLFAGEIVVSGFELEIEKVGFGNKTRFRHVTHEGRLAGIGH
jgi:hypothetical protein